MQKNKVKNVIMTGILVISLALLVGKIGQCLFAYYTGPMYVIDQYIDALNQGHYHKIYHLLSKESLMDVGGEREVEKYFNKYYREDYKLIKVMKIGWLKEQYMVHCQFQDSDKKQALQMTREKGGNWRIKFPFELNEVSIIAPNGSKVYFGNEALTYRIKEGYKKDKVLPGLYMVKVELPDASDRPYYKMISVPEHKKLVLPYELGHLKVECAPGLMVKLNPLEEMSTEEGVQWYDVMVGQYTLTINHPYDYLEPIEKEIELFQGDNNVAVETFKLSSVGEKKLETFLEAFYACYEQGIKQHSSSILANYFEEANRQSQLELFNEWYIKQKNIIKADIERSCGDVSIDEKGNLHSMIVEKVLLVNREYSKLEEKEVEKQYKVILYWDTTIDIKQKEWQIVDRQIAQSMIAFKDLEGKWVQY